MTLRLTKTAITFLGIFLAFVGIGHAQTREMRHEIVTTILPLQSLAAAIMSGRGTPHQIISANQSEHQYAAKPSDMSLLTRANAVFWIGPTLESALAPSIRANSPSGAPVNLLAAPGLKLISQSTSSRPDPHIWLDPANGIQMAAAMAETLRRIDPDGAPAYDQNLHILKDRLTALDRRIATVLQPIVQKPYLVYHPALRYFEARYGLNARGAVVASPEQQLGAKRLTDVRDQILREGIVCVFSEPQIPTRAIQPLIEGTSARHAVIDGMGAGLAPGPDAYEQLLMAIARSLANCLGN